MLAGAGDTLSTVAVLGDVQWSEFQMEIGTIAIKYICRSGFESYFGKFISNHEIAPLQTKMRQA